jgi:hypothetical protein
MDFNETWKLFTTHCMFRNIIDFTSVVKFVWCVLKHRSMQRPASQSGGPKHCLPLLVMHVTQSTPQCRPWFLLCWQNSFWKMSFNYSRHCFVCRMFSWHFSVLPIAMFLKKCLYQITRSTPNLKWSVTVPGVFTLQIVMEFRIVAFINLLNILLGLSLSQWWLWRVLASKM